MYTSMGFAEATGELGGADYGCPWTLRVTQEHSPDTPVRACG